MKITWQNIMALACMIIPGAASSSITSNPVSARTEFIVSHQSTSTVNVIKPNTANLHAGEKAEGVSVAQVTVINAEPARLALRWNLSSGIRGPDDSRRIVNSSSGIFSMDLAIRNNAATSHISTGGSTYFVLDEPAISSTWDIRTGSRQIFHPGSYILSIDSAVYIP